MKITRVDDHPKKQRKVFTLKVNNDIKHEGRNRMEKELKGWVKCPVCGQSKVGVYKGSKGYLSTRCKVCNRISVYDLEGMKAWKGRTISHRETGKDIPEKGVLKCSICGKSKVVIYQGAKGEVSVTCSNCGHINDIELSSMIITHGEIIGNQLKRKTA